MMKTLSFVCMLSGLIYAQGTVEQKLLVEFPNGKKDTLALSFKVQAKASVQESGKGASLLHPFDNRRCDIEAQADITRTAFWVLPGGNTQVFGPAQKEIISEKNNQQVDSSCEEAKASTQSLKAKLQNALHQALPEKLSQGLLNSSIQELQQLLGAKTITPVGK